MIPSDIKFWIYLFGLIQAILCSIFILYHILFDRNLRRALHNHIIIILLCLGCFCQLTNYPWMLYFYRTENGWDRSEAFCLVYVFVDWSLYVTQTVLFAWATIERHILIFHDRFVATARGRFLFHYLPIVLLLLYCLIYYVLVVFFPPCQHVFDPTMLQCTVLCVLKIYPFLIYEMILHQILPVFVIVISSILLLVRVVWQKHRMNRPMDWRKHRKLTIQILSISILYVMFALPLAIVFIILITNQTSDDVWTAMDAGNFLSYFPLLFLPAVWGLSLPEMRSKINKLIRFRNQTMVVLLTQPNTNPRPT